MRLPAVADPVMETQCALAAGVRVVVTVVADIAAESEAIMLAGLAGEFVSRSLSGSQSDDEEEEQQLLLALPLP